jgi:16S rRNA (cytidine1402-2'-O)-methyltransferase
MGILYLVATPIGNLEDISARALHILREVRLIAAEDTRLTRKLLAHFDIHTPLTSYHEHSQPGKLSRLLQELAQGDIALVSDAGTPALNDPGYELVRAALEQQILVRPIPGPSAPIAALVCSGLPTDKFLYLGYLPQKKGDRRRQIADVAAQPYTLIFLETPHRLLAALEDLRSILGDREIAIARELTKVYEEILRGTLQTMLEIFSNTEPLGEFTLVIAGKKAESSQWSEAQLRRSLQEHLENGGSRSAIAAELANRSGWPRRKVYRLANEIRVARDD